MWIKDVFVIKTVGYDISTLLAVANIFTGNILQFWIIKQQNDFLIRTTSYCEAYFFKKW